ncbi:MAG: alpha/beta hydrolase-fold protein [Candidatus Sumerlaeia bacterium]|nr:alpha/beta hydrolase-fold protein [Candidatus Sumerlaeia bacterium]
MRRFEANLYSPAVGRHLPVMVYGHFGVPIVVFPSMSSSHREWEDQGMIHVLHRWIEAGKCKIYVTQSIEWEAWMNWNAPPQWRAHRALHFYDYILNQLVPFVREDCQDPGARPTASGVSVGALHAANCVLKYPQLFSRCLGFSGRYDLGPWFDGFYNDDVYRHDPLAYAPNLEGGHLDYLRQNAHLTLVVGQGDHEGSCPDQARRLGQVLTQKGIPNWTDVWGHDSAHQWNWWQRQAVYHFEKWLGPA